jgi:hypothetical protein
VEEVFSANYLCGGQHSPPTTGKLPLGKLAKQENLPFPEGPRLPQASKSTSKVQHFKTISSGVVTEAFSIFARLQLLPSISAYSDVVEKGLPSFIVSWFCVLLETSKADGPFFVANIALDNSSFSDH